MKTGRPLGSTNSKSPKERVLRQRAKSERYRRSHLAKEAERHRKWAKANRQAVNEIQARWRAKNKL